MKLLLYKDGYNIYRLTKELDFIVKGVYFYSKTEDEFSLVCSETNLVDCVDKAEYSYSLFRIDGVLDFSLIGIIAKISKLLADQGFSIFVVSTFNTDYILVKNSNLDKSIKILESNDYTIENNI